MIVGIGVDIVNVSRMQSLLTKPWGSRFVQRVLHPTEHAYFLAESHQKRAYFLAKRFAAKEAFSKAWGSGIRHPVTWHALLIHHDASGRPLFVFEGDLSSAIDQRAWRAHLSLSDERDHTIAFVVIDAA